MATVFYLETKERKLPIVTEEFFKKTAEKFQKVCWEDSNAQSVLEEIRKSTLTFVDAQLKNNRNFCELAQSVQERLILVNEKAQILLPPQTPFKAYSNVTFHQLENKEFLCHLTQSGGTKRSTGVKYFLSHGTTIYTETFFQPNTIVAKLSPVLDFLLERLSVQRAYSAWSTANTLLLEAFIRVSSAQKDAQYQQIQMQIGADASNVCIGLRYSFPYKNLADIAADLYFDENSDPSPWLMSKQNSDYFEVRTFTGNPLLEITSIFDRNMNSKRLQSPALLRNSQHVELESIEDVKEYEFKPFSSLNAGKTSKKNKNPEERTFKKQLTKKIEGVTDQIKEEKITVKGGEAPTETETIIKSSTPPTPEAKATVQGVTEHINTDAKTVVKGGEANTKEEILQLKEILLEKDPNKKVSLLKSKIESLQAAVDQRDEAMKRLHKEIEEINDPLRRGVVGSVVDQQKEGLADNIKRLEGLIREKEKKEKEFIAMLDKATKARDEAIKLMKEFELKAKTSANAGGNTVKITQLEKQLEQSNKQRSELGNRVTKLVNQLTKVGLRPEA